MYFVDLTITDDAYLNTLRETVGTGATEEYKTTDFRGVPIPSCVNATQSVAF